MKRYIIPLAILIVLVIAFSLFYFRNNLFNPTREQSNYEADRVSTENSISSESNKVTEENTTTEVPTPTVVEQEMASFATQVSGTSARKNNISICTSILNETTVNPEETFSFLNTIGSMTKERGFQKAKSFHHNGQTTKTYGGGVCQVSSTLYNAVLLVPECEVIERHPHSKPVTYVEKDKDAAVSHPSTDFRFKNNSANLIKIYASFDNTTLSIRLVALVNS